MLAKMKLRKPPQGKRSPRCGTRQLSATKIDDPKTLDREEATQSGDDQSASEIEVDGKQREIEDGRHGDLHAEDNENSGINVGNEEAEASGDDGSAGGTDLIEEEDDEGEEDEPPEDVEGSCNLNGGEDATDEEDSGDGSESDFTCTQSPSRGETEVLEEEEGPVETTKSANIAALIRGDLILKRQALLPKVLSVADGAAVARGAFKSPIPSHVTSTSELQRRLSARRRFVPWQTSQPFVQLANLLPQVDLPLQEFPLSEDQDLPPGIEPLILWQAEGETGEPASISVDPGLTKFLRPHQREGVQFMFECVSGLRKISTAEDESSPCCGCILADDMGLGKTLQSIALLWTLLRQGFMRSPMVKRVLIVTPTSLVSNWEAELNKWLDGRVNVMAIGESTRAEAILGISNFLGPRNVYQVMIISYETFRQHSAKFEMEGSCDLLICDEAHRLKNDQTLTNQALASLDCRRRVLLSGTPIQNDLEEFFAIVNFANPGILGNASDFRRYYENPILAGREPDASDEAQLLSAERSSKLSEIVNQFILRRTNSLLSNHLPPKIIQVVCCKLSSLQLKLYEHFIHSKNVRQVLEDKTKRAKVLASITALKKLCNHPKLIYDSMRAGGSQAAGFEDCMKYFPQGIFGGRMGTASVPDGSWIEFSGKMGVLVRLLVNVREKTDDRIVLVSNYTQTLDLFSQICRERRFPYVRLDGTTTPVKRRKMVQRFNDFSQNEFAFLLSSKAGGCGLNLIGGNRLVLFDPDWNPATDKQAAARVWRDGQKKRVYLYRFLAAGTIEEKVYQRQLSKEGLQKVVDAEQSTDRKAQVNDISTEDLRDLFNLQKFARSSTHETLGCKRCGDDTDVTSTTTVDQESNGEDKNFDIGRFAEISGCLHKLRPWEKQVGNPPEEDLKNWAHHTESDTIPDVLLQSAAGDQVTFAFTCQVDGKLAPLEPVVRGPRLHDSFREKPRRTFTPLPATRSGTRPLGFHAENKENQVLSPDFMESADIHLDTEKGSPATERISNSPLRSARTPAKRISSLLSDVRGKKLAPSVNRIDDESEGDDFA